MATSGQSPDTSWLPAGMDPKSSYLLEIRLVGNPKKYREDFSCFSFSKVVDSDLCNFKDLVGEIVDKYPHGYKEIVHIFYFDDVQKCFPKVTTDQELLQMFSKHVDSNVVHMTMICTEPTDVVPVPEPYTLENSEMLDIPCTPSMPCPPLATVSQSTDPTSSQHAKPSTSQSTNPTSSQPAKPTTSQPIEPSTKQPDGDEYLANPLPQNEHVGVDDEGLYLAASTAQKGVYKGSDSESDSNYDEGYEEDDGLIGKDPLPPTTLMAYDRDDPPMSEE